MPAALVKLTLEGTDEEEAGDMPTEGSRMRGKGGLNKGWRSGWAAEAAAGGLGRGAVAACDALPGSCEPATGALDGVPVADCELDRTMATATLLSGGANAKGQAGWAIAKANDTIRRGKRQQLAPLTSTVSWTRPTPMRQTALR